MTVAQYRICEYTDGSPSEACIWREGELVFSGLLEDAGPIPKSGEDAILEVWIDCVPYETRFYQQEFHDPVTVSPASSGATAESCASCGLFGNRRRKRDRSMDRIPWFRITLLAMIPAALMLWKPEFNNALTAYILSFVLMILSVMMANTANTSADAQRVRQQWLPQAELACKSLLRIRYDAACLQETLRCGCQTLQEPLSGLAQTRSAAIKREVDSHCRQCLANLASVINHLDGAIENWQRFIEDNCEEGECTRINDALERTRAELKVLPN